MVGNNGVEAKTDTSNMIDIYVDTAFILSKIAFSLNPRLYMIERLCFNRAQIDLDRLKLNVPCCLVVDHV